MRGATVHAVPTPWPRSSVRHPTHGNAAQGLTSTSQSTKGRPLDLLGSSHVRDTLPLPGSAATLEGALGPNTWVSKQVSMESWLLHFASTSATWLGVDSMKFQDRSKEAPCTVEARSAATGSGPSYALVDRFKARTDTISWGPGVGMTTIGPPRELMLRSTEADGRDHSTWAGTDVMEFPPRDRVHRPVREVRESGRSPTRLLPPRAMDCTFPPLTSHCTPNHGYPRVQGLPWSQLALLAQ